MKSRALKICATLLLLILTVYLLYPRPLPAEPLPPASAAAHDAAAAVNAFAFDLLAELRTRPGNLCLSPYSIHTALAMAHEGAAKRTADQLAAALHLIPAARAGQHDLHARLQAPGHHGFELSVANRLWLDRSATVLPAFNSRLEKDFFADAQTVDFASPVTIPAINSWTSQHTNGRIPNVLSPEDLTSPTVLVLTNAIYFKGDWDVPFRKSDTAEGDFFTAPDCKVRAMLMHQTKKHDYADLDAAGGVPAFRALSLDYTCGDLTLLLLLPELGQLDQLEGALNDRLLAATLKNLREVHLPVILPRFTITDSFTLFPTSVLVNNFFRMAGSPAKPSPLESLGITDAFNPKAADSSNLSPQPLFLSAVIHKTFIEVNEQGTEAAAATAGAAVGSAIPMKPPEFKADHPFLFLLREKSTGAILFLGRVSAP